MLRGVTENEERRGGVWTFYLLPNCFIEVLLSISSVVPIYVSPYECGTACGTFMTAAASTADMLQVEAADHNKTVDSRYIKGHTAKICRLAPGIAVACSC